MRAFVMAAGRGTRLAPLTDVLPKPALPVGNEPVMGRLLRLLARHGVRDIAANACYRADLLQQVIGDGTAYGVELTWSVEESMLGTAGGLKRLESQLRDRGEPVLVLSGDGLHEVDVTALIRAHRASGAIATIALSPVDDPGEYGVAVLDERGFVTGFQEKPRREDARSNLCNTGIYVFEPGVFDRIPPEVEHDFGTQLFPTLVDEGVPVFGVPIEGYWNDVGGLDAYRDGNLAVVDGRCGEEGDGGVLVHASARIDGSATIAPPSVIGANAVVGAQARLASSVVLPGAEVPAGGLLASATYGSAIGLVEWARSLA